MAEEDSLHISISADTGGAAQNINSTADALERLDNSANTAGGDMSQLVQALAAAASNMTAAAQNIASAASGLTNFQSQIDAISTAVQSISTRFGGLSGTVQTTFGTFDGAAGNMSAFSEASRQAASYMDAFNIASADVPGMMSMLGSSVASAREEFVNVQTAMRGFMSELQSSGGGSSDLDKKIAELEDKVKKLETALKNSTPAVNSLTAAFGKLKGVMAGLGFGAFIKQSNDAYNVQMQNELKLTSHMKHRMNATEDQIQAIKDLASAQQQIGVIGDEIQLAGAQQLTTYAKQVSTIQTLIPAMNNLIAQNAGYDASAGDATSAADMLGRALNGQYTSLKRQGITFTEAQEQILKYGTESQKAALLAQLINDKIGNMNELLAQTPTGKLKQLQNDFGDLQEQLGATFQPLISAVLPIAREFMEELAPHVLNFSKGITAIGKAIAAVDSPGVRAIALAAAGIAVVNKLRLAIGGTSAGLLVLGIILTAIIGSMNETESIGDVVSNAYNSATDSIKNTTDGLENFQEEIGETQKAVSKLAGFDTITKLSGGSSTGLLVSGLLGDDPEGQFGAFADAAKEAEEAVKSIGDDSIEIIPDINLRDAGKKIRDWCEEQDWELMFLQAGNAIEEVFSGAFSIVDGLFGTDLQKTFDETRDHFFEVGKDIEGAMQEIGSGDGYQALHGVNTLLVSISDMLTGGLFTKQIDEWNKGWQHVGQSLYDLLNPTQEVLKEHGILNQENSPGIINNFSPIEGAPLAAYYKWGSSGMPSFVPKWQVTSMGDNRIISSAPSPSSSPSQSDIAGAYRPGVIPSSVTNDNITINLNVDGETIAVKLADLNSGLITNGAY